jgi:hypothetical protein
MCVSKLPQEVAQICFAGEGTTALFYVSITGCHLVFNQQRMFQLQLGRVLVPLCPPSFETELGIFFIRVICCG